MSDIYYPYTVRRYTVRLLRVMVKITLCGEPQKKIPVRATVEPRPSGGSSGDLTIDPRHPYRLTASCLPPPSSRFIGKKRNRRKNGI